MRYLTGYSHPRPAYRGTSIDDRRPYRGNVFLTDDTVPYKTVPKTAWRGALPPLLHHSSVDVHPAFMQNDAGSYLLGHRKNRGNSWICCRSSVVEHSLGKGEVESSILSGSTTLSPRDKGKGEIGLGTEKDTNARNQPETSGENPGKTSSRFAWRSPAEGDYPRANPPSIGITAPVT